VVTYGNEETTAADRVALSSKQKPTPEPAAAQPTGRRLVALTTDLHDIDVASVGSGAGAGALTSGPDACFLPRSRGNVGCSDPVGRSDPVGDSDPVGQDLATVAAQAHALGLHRIDMVAWRDLDDPEAGGSELHADQVAAQWAEAGFAVRLSTSSIDGTASTVQRNGYVAHRRSGRYGVFPRTALRNLLAGEQGRDALVEVWNGMPFLSPLWARCPRVVFLHHVHAEMWQMALPRPLAELGNFVERRLAPPLYRSSRIVTLSASSRREILSMLRLRPDRVSVVSPGVDDRFRPGGQPSKEPLVVAVGRLVPVKRFDLLIDALVGVRQQHPTLRAVIVGEGYERPALEARIRRHRAEQWIELVGRVDDDHLATLYRQAWVLASMSQREGWGMTITEAAACGTPAVVSRIAGHADAVEDGVSGILVEDQAGLAHALHQVLADEVLRSRLSRRAQARSAELTWEATAAGALAALVDEAARRTPSRRAKASWRAKARLDVFRPD